MGIAENKELIRRLHEQGFPGDPDGLDRYFAPDYVGHLAWTDLAGMKEALRALKAAFPTVEWKIDDLIAEGDKVAVCCTLLIRSATRPLRAVGTTSIYALRNGKIVEQWGHGDPLV